MHPMPKPGQHSLKAAVESPELTPRETEVLFWISEGKSNRDISIILGAKTRTICKHVEHIFSKLNVENRTSAALVALEKFRSFAEKSRKSSGKSWTAVAGLIGTQLGEVLLDGCEVFDTLSSFVA